MVFGEGDLPISYAQKNIVVSTTRSVGRTAGPCVVDSATLYERPG